MSTSRTATAATVHSPHRDRRRNTVRGARRGRCPRPSGSGSSAVGMRQARAMFWSNARVLPHTYCAASTATGHRAPFGAGEPPESQAICAPGTSPGLAYRLRSAVPNEGSHQLA